MKNDNIKVYLTTMEAEKFKEFQKYHDTFILLFEKGIFDIRNGSAILNFDAFGTITTIHRNDVLYNHRVNSLQIK